MQLLCLHPYELRGGSGVSFDFPQRKKPAHL